MHSPLVSRVARFLTSMLTLAVPGIVLADGDLQHLNHVIVLMQENHSFDNYFGALPYAPGGPYHPGENGCAAGDHACVDGLTCRIGAAGDLTCSNSNPEDDGGRVRAFHDPSRCARPDLNHSWFPTHLEMNFNEPNETLREAPADGFVRENDATEQLDGGVESPSEDQTMGFYTQDDLPLYYELAQKFAIDDRYFASVLGPTFPNRAYLLAGTSFGHLTTNDTFPPPGGYKPITGTIFDKLDAQRVSWADYFQDAPQGGSFRLFSATGHDPHFLPLPVLLAQVAGVPGVGPLPSVSFVDPNFGLFGPAAENDEHPPTDIQRGQAFVSQVLDAIRSGSYWKDTVVFITYDEHGGYYDHVKPPHARQGHTRTPDGISPGQCADLSNPPTSLQPGAGAECAVNPFSATDTSVRDAEMLCPQFASHPTGPYPPECASFDQLGVRVPFLAVSPFAKSHYVSHTTGDHTSILAFIEKRFLTLTADGSAANADDEEETGRAHLTRRDQHAHTLEDLFDFDASPSLTTTFAKASSPANDCTPVH